MKNSVNALVGNPLSLDQLRLWRAMLDCPAQSFRSYGIVKVAGNLSLARLRDAFEHVSRDYDLLRSRLVRIPGMVYPVLMSGNAGPAVYCDMGVFDGDNSSAVERMAHELVSYRFPLEGSSLIYVCFGQLKTGEALWGLAAPSFLADGPSVEILLKRISRVASNGDSAAMGNGLEPSLPYSSISQWRERLMESEEAEAGKRLWQERLIAHDDAHLDTIVPAASGHQPGDSPDIRRVEARLPAEIGARFAEADPSAATSSRFFAAWYFLLWKLCNCPAADFRVAAHFDGRSVTDLASAIGPLERFLPIVAPVDPNQQWRALCDEVARQLESAGTWQDCFSWSRSDALEDSSAKMRSFDYCFEFFTEFVESGAKLALMRRYSRSERYKIKLDVMCSRENGCELVLYYDLRHISNHHAAEVIGAYRYLLEQMAADKMVGLKDLRWPATARNGAEATATNRPASVDTADVRDRLIRTAAQYPDRIALASDEQSLSYARLNERTDALAQTIRSRALEPESCIAMVGGISFDTIIGLIGILKAGHCFVHIDPEHPPARTEKVLRECGARLILHEAVTRDPRLQILAERLRLDPAAVVDVKEASLRREATCGNSSNPALHSDQLAYIIYTSGSTGEPNGVMISHGSLAKQIAWLTGAFGFHPDNSWLLKTPLGFDASVWEWMTPLCLGATLVFGGKDLHLDPARIVKKVRDHKVTALQMVPNLLRIMINAAKPEDMSSLRYLFSGGEALPPDVCQAIHQGWRARLINLYGPTETTINATWWEVPRELPRWAEIPIGHPVDGMSALILDKLGQELPPHFIGELHLTGSGLARGYVQKPDATADKFMACHLGAGQRMYRTGDLVSCDEDGTLFYWGRRDNQVKLRGYRIELGEIEALLSSHAAVQTAAVCISGAIEDVDAAQLIAYVVPNDRSSRPDTQEFRDYLRARLPEYMVPASIIVLHELPLTRTGKVDRKALASRDFVDQHRSASYVASETSTQAKLCEIWRRVLGVEMVGIKDDFLALGGQSLLVARLIGHIRDALGIDVSPRLIFDFPVLQDFAEQIDQLHSLAGESNRRAPSSPELKAHASAVTPA
jgi:amino acid adenylation domain-containing protein